MNIRTIKIIAASALVLIIFLAVSSSKAYSSPTPEEKKGGEWSGYTDDTLVELLENAENEENVSISKELDRRYEELIKKKEQETKELLATRLSEEQMQREGSLDAESVIALAVMKRDLPEPAPMNTLPERALERAMTQIGKPYVWGAVGPDTYDCSGLVLWAYNQEGYFRMPRTTNGQWTQGEAVRKDGVKKGDLIYFLNNPDKAPVDHVGIYIGEGKMLHAPRPGAYVEIKAVPWDNMITIRRHIK